VPVKITKSSNARSRSILIAARRRFGRVSRRQFQIDSMTDETLEPHTTTTQTEETIKVFVRVRPANEFESNTAKFKTGARLAVGIVCIVLSVVRVDAPARSGQSS
jgi:hypothetical protein